MPPSRSRLTSVVYALANAERDCAALGLDVIAAKLSALGVEAATLRDRDDVGEQFHPHRTDRARGPR